RPRKNGDPTPSGWMAEHTSWRKPGRVSSAVREPPPGVAAASSTSTDRPACASVRAAARPLGPAPITIASVPPAPSAPATFDSPTRRLWDAAALRAVRGLEAGMAPARGDGSFTRDANPAHNPAHE